MLLPSRHPLCPVGAECLRHLAILEIPVPAGRKISIGDRALLPSRQLCRELLYSAHEVAGRPLRGRRRDAAAKPLYFGAPYLEAGPRYPTRLRRFKARNRLGGSPTFL